MKNLERNREGDFLFRLRDFIFCEGVFAMRMKHPPYPLHKGDIKKGMKNAFTSFTGM
jgi:hypothetical protein